ncbi:MAG TPA: histidine kinase [Longimicrobiales bacterium]|nr:histidine kinase [Longimicrobiales bacterium]
MIRRKKKILLAWFGAATLIGLIEAAQLYAGMAAMDRPISWLDALRSTLPSWYVLLLLVPAIVWLSRRFPLEPVRWHRTLPLHLLAAVLFAFLHVAASSWLGDYVLSRGPQPPWSLSESLSRLLTTFFVLELLTYFAVVGAYNAYDYGRRYREREGQAARLALRTSRLEASLSRAKLDSLRMQLNPHFLFNTLNAISVMAMKGEREGVVRMLMLLSDLLRLSLDNRQHVLSLRDELAILDCYLEIENVRFRDRLTVERDIDPAVLDAEVPSLVLQPLVENAIRHGISRRAGPGVVRVEADAMDGKWLELRVLDTGPGVDATAASDGNGVGLANTRARLEQLYGSRQQLTLSDRAEGGACATVRLPLRQYEGEPLEADLQTAAV